MADYPVGKFRFKVEIGGADAGGFSEASGFDITINAVDYREGAMDGTPIKVDGLRKYSNITLKRGTTSSKQLYEWFEACIDKAIERKTIAITLMDATKGTVASWQVINAWPVKYTAPDFSASADEIAIEQIEFAHEGLTRTT